MTERRRLAQRVERAAGSLAKAATARMEAELPWFRDLSADHRSWVGLVAQAGIAGFVEWLRTPVGAAARPVFSAAPREIARVVTLQQTVELVRIAVDTVEAHVDGLAGPTDAPALREELLRFSREVAFAAADVYASAAEERGAWHARLRALLVEALVRGEPPEAVRERATALGWVPARQVAVAVGLPGPGEPEAVLDEVERVFRVAGMESLAGLHGDWLVVVAGADAALPRRLAAAAGAFADGPVVLGPVHADIGEAAASATAALSGARVAGAWPAAPRPVAADDLLPERALDGDLAAQAELVDIYKHLSKAGDPVLHTVATYLDLGGSVEATARALFLHPNTVRYRLKKAIEAAGTLVTEPRGALVVRLALVLGRLAP